MSVNNSSIVSTFMLHLKKVLCLFHGTAKRIGQAYVNRHFAMSMLSVNGTSLIIVAVVSCKNTTVSQIVYCYVNSQKIFLSVTGTEVFAG